MQLNICKHMENGAIEGIQYSISVMCFDNKESRRRYHSHIPYIDEWKWIEV